MTIKEYIEQLSKKDIDMNKVRQIQTIFRTYLPEDIMKLVSNCDETVFLDDDYRILSFDEIAEAENDLHVDFKDKGILPLVDCGENDFIVFHFIEGTWSKFNIIDETVFQKRDSLLELFQ